MTQRSFLDEDDDIQPRRRRASPELERALKHLLPAEDAITDDPLILLDGMQTVMYMPSPGKKPWHARAKGSQDFGQGSTPMEAMCEAMILKLRSQKR